MDTIQRILDHKGATVHRVPPTATVHEAVEKMCENRVGAILICDGGVCRGIFTERDLMARVILDSREPRATPVSEVMTSDIVVVEPETGLEEAMAIMTERRCRHLPVVSEGKVSGIVSIGDLVRWTSHDHEFHIRMLTNFITGQYPG